jgi:hypothetical protein
MASTPSALLMGAPVGPTVILRRGCGSRRRQSFSRLLGREQCLLLQYVLALILQFDHRLDAGHKVLVSFLRVAFMHALVEVNVILKLILLLDLAIEYITKCPMSEFYSAHIVKDVIPLYQELMQVTVLHLEL